MSEVNVNDTARGPLAGNTNANLFGRDRDEAVQTVIESIVEEPFVIKFEPEVEKPGLPSAADLDEVAKEAEIAAATAAVHTGDPENTFDVSRAEFEELQEAVIRLNARIHLYNQGAPHRI